jgi:hypothetical protein
VHISVLEWRSRHGNNRDPYKAINWTTSFSENQQGNKQRGHKTDQQFHHSLLGRGLAGWLNVTWLAGGEAGTAIYTWKGWQRVTIGLKITRRSFCLVIAVQ